MSNYRVIAEVSQALKAIIWREFEADSDFNEVSSEEEIVFKNPEETAKDSANRLSLWLYHISENEYVKNQTMQRGNGQDSLQFPPLALDFFYLVTPFGPSGEIDQLILGKTMEVFYDNAIIPIDNQEDDIAEELRVILCRLSLEELSRIWEALRQSYRLSVCYRVRVARIDSRRRPFRKRVSEQNSHFFGET